MSFPRRLIPLGGALACGVAIGWGAGLVSGRVFEVGAGARAGGVQASRARPGGSVGSGRRFCRRRRKALGGFPGVPPRPSCSVGNDRPRRSRDSHRATGQQPRSRRFCEGLFGGGKLAWRSAVCDGSREALGEGKPRRRGKFRSGAFRGSEFPRGGGRSVGRGAPREAMAWIDRVAPQPGHRELTFLILNVIGQVGVSDPREAIDLWNRHWTHVAERVRHNQTLLVVRKLGETRSRSGYNCRPRHTDRRA